MKLVAILMVIPNAAGAVKHPRAPQDRDQPGTVGLRIHIADAGTPFGR
jgi:hypothetical protein